MHELEFAALKSRFPDLPGTRSIIRLNISRIADSCGWTVPLYEFAGTRDYYDNYAEKLGAVGIRAGQLAANMRGIDGLRGLDSRRYDASFGNTRSVSSMNVSWLSGDAMR